MSSSMDVVSKRAVSRRERASGAMWTMIVLCWKDKSNSLRSSNHRASWPELV